LDVGDLAYMDVADDADDVRGCTITHRRRMTTASPFDTTLTFTRTASLSDAAFSCFLDSDPIGFLPYGSYALVGSSQVTKVRGNAYVDRISRIWPDHYLGALSAWSSTKHRAGG
jgi:hypothetical protein